MLALLAAVLLAADPAPAPDAGAAVPPELAQVLPSLPAYRASSPPRIDGVLDDEAWAQATGFDKFVQQVPDPGKEPSQHTRIQFAYDDQNLYVAFRCDDDDPATMVTRLTRRDRFIDADGIYVEIDSLGDKTSAYGFGVYSSGTQIDYLRTGDNAQDPNWDAVWDSAARVDAHGYSIEMAIPFRQLRFKHAAEATFRFNAFRFTTRREELDELVYTPPDTQGTLLRMATLTGLRDLPRGHGLELRPFVLGKLGHRYSPGPGYDPPSGTHPGLAVGGDLTYHPTRDLVLDATVLPDFGQVEADQVVLNLSTFETFFPEKRPFFLSGADLFAVHDEQGNPTTTQLFYSRRIGRPPPPPTVGEGERLLDQPLETRIWGAAKLTGKVSDRLSVALLEAVPAAETATVQAADGATREQRVSPLANFGVARLRADLPGGFTAGAMATAVNRRDVGLIDPSGYCPDSDLPGPDGRCTADAYAGAVDATWSSDDGTYVASGALLGSHRVGGPEIDYPDGTVLRTGDSGYGGQASVAKAGGTWLWRATYEGYSDKLDLNDAGYLRRQNYHHAQGRVGWRQVQPVGPFLYAEAGVEPYLARNTDGVDLGAGAYPNAFVRWKNYWATYLELDVLQPRHFDDRELRDGGRYERPTVYGVSWFVGSDPRQQFGGSTNGYVGNTLRGVDAHASLSLFLNLLGRLELGLQPRIDWTTGDPRWYQTDGEPGGARTYRLADLDARATSVTFRGTYTFSPTLSLQAYAQLYLETDHYGQGWAYDAEIAKPYVYLDRLRPEQAEPGLDFKDAALNVNVVARWEYRPGSTLYLVYTRAQTPGDPTLGQNPVRPDLPALRRGPTDDVLLLKASYYFGT